MDKNTYIGLFLIAAVLIGFSFWNQQQVATEPVVTAETQQTPTAKPEKAQASSTVLDTTSLFSNQAIANAEAGAKPAVVTLKNDNVAIDINTNGGTIANVRLLNFKSYADFRESKNNPLRLLDEKLGGMQFEIPTTSGIINTADYRFTAVEQTDSTGVTMQMVATDGSMFSIAYKLEPGDAYMLTASLQGNSRLAKHMASTTKAIGISWKQKIPQHEKGYDFENQYSTITYKLTEGSTEKLKETDSESEHAESQAQWVAFKNQYFSSILISPVSGLDNLYVDSRQIKPEEEAGFLKDYAATAELAFDASGLKPTQIQFYFGPNSFNLLKAQDKHAIDGKDLELEDIVYLGWPIVRWVNRFFTIYVFDFLTAMGLPMGIVLLLITLLLRVIVYYPTRKSFMSSARMRVLRPKVDEISKKYPRPEDNLQKQQAMMALYSDYGVSPMGGCLPVLIQMPIWIAMFNFVPNAIELRQQSFLWAEDLSTYDSIVDFGTYIPAIGDHLSLFCVLFCATNLLYSWMTMRQQQESLSGEQAQQMKMMQYVMFLMPVMFFFMFNRYSAGLNYYYFISLLASALTMWYLRRTTDDAKLLAQLEANYKANKSNPNRKASGMAARLAAMQKQMEEMQKQQNQRNATKN